MEAGARSGPQAPLRRDRRLGVARRRILRIVGVGVGLALAGPAVLGVEALIATRGEPAPPLASGIDACVGCDGSVPPLRTFWMGDSTAAGFGADTAEGVLGRQVARRLARPVDVHVLASGGKTVREVVAEQLPRLPADAQVVFVSVGANDTTHLSSTGSFSSWYRKLREAVPASACLVLLGIPDMGSPPRLAQPLRSVAGLRGRLLDREIQSLAAEAGATFVDIAGATGPAFRRDRSLFARDGYHPNDAGYALWAGAVTSALASAGLPGGKCP